jgi:hypothetical protein
MTLRELRLVRTAAHNFAHLAAIGFATFGVNWLALFRGGDYGYGGLASGRGVDQELQLRVWLSVRFQCQTNAGLLQGLSGDEHQERPLQ